MLVKENIYSDKKESYPFKKKFNFINSFPYIFSQKNKEKEDLEEWDKWELWKNKMK